MAFFALTAVGTDRPGIVAAVTGALAESGCNLDDSSMTILHGQFAMMLVVDAPPGVGAPELERALAGPAATLDLVVAVRPTTEPAVAARSPDTGSWTLSVHGADRPGIVHGVAALLAAESVNIVDLTTRVVGGPDDVYAMVLEITLPAALDPSELERRLEATAGELGVTCRLHPAEADIL